MSFQIHTDQIMWDCFKNLQSDLATYVRPEIIALDDIASVRDYEFSSRWSSPYAYKCNAQLVSWLKRYRFEHDVLTDSELSAKTNDKFMADQLRIASFKPLTSRSRVVLLRARKIIRSVLGKSIDWEEVYPLCRFSRNGTAGFGGENVYLDVKLSKYACITGTATEIEWFKDYLDDDSLLSSIWDSDEPWYTPVISLRQVNVPKTAVIMRPVRPNTLIGSYITYGVGKYIANLMRDVLNIDLNNLQGFHQFLARKGSKSMKNVTADLSSASDSFTFQLMNWLLPRRWLSILNKLRTPCVDIDGNCFNSPSFMAMGIGYTFPLMTLCFYSILLALSQLSGIKGRISVFGDDLIYPRRLHPYVEIMFSDLNFQLNREKTFSDIPFRESCGGDYYEGLDVRPARPEGVPTMLTSETSICAYVFKLYNSLVRRWEGRECELPKTLTYLRNLARNLGCDYSVPDHFPDDSGFKDGNWVQASKREVDKGNRRHPFYQGFQLPCLICRNDIRPVGLQTVYLHEKIRPTPLTSGVYSPSATDVLLWRWKKYKRGSTAKRTYRKLVAYTSKRGVTFINQASMTFS